MKRSFKQREVVKRAVMHLLMECLTSFHFPILVGRLTAESWFQGGSLIVVVSVSYIPRRDVSKWLKSILIDAFIIHGRESFLCSHH